jgi:hypothetical protein
MFSSVLKVEVNKAITWKPLQVSGTQEFSIVSGDIKFAVIPILDISVQFRSHHRDLSLKQQTNVLVQTDGRVSFPVEVGLVKAGNKICSASYKMLLNFELLSISSPVLGFTKSIDAKSTDTQLHQDDVELCATCPPSSGVSYLKYSYKFLLRVFKFCVSNSY